MKKVKSQPKCVIVTFGYGNRSNYDDIKEVIHRYQVSYVIDVRKKPRGWSALWSSQQLNKLCESLNIHYLSKTALGNESGNKSWEPPDPQSAEEALTEVSKLLPANNILLLCAEKDPMRCHRVEVSQRIQSLSGAKLIHFGSL